MVVFVCNILAGLPLLELSSVMRADIDTSLEGWGVPLLAKLHCQEGSKEDQYQPLFLSFCISGRCFGFRPFNKRVLV